MTDSDRMAIIVFVVIIYVVFVWLSIEGMISVLEEFEHNPWLIDRRWKRALWIISCLIFTPLLILASRAPRYLFSEIKDFIIGSNAACEENDNHEEK